MKVQILILIFLVTHTNQFSLLSFQYSIKIENLIQADSDDVTFFISIIENFVLDPNKLFCLYKIMYFLLF